MRRLFQLALLATLAISPAHAQTVTSFAQGTNNDNTLQTFNVNPSTNISAGQHGVCALMNEDGQPPTDGVSDSGAHTWTRREAVVAGSSFLSCYEAALANGLTTSSTITFKKAVNTNRPSIYKCGATDTANGFDVSGPANASGTTMAVSTSATTSQADTIAFGFWTMDTDVAFNLTPSGDAYTALGTRPTPIAGANSGGAGHVMDAGYKVLNTQGVKTATSTRGTGSVAWGACLIVIKAGGGGAAPAGFNKENKLERLESLLMRWQPLFAIWGTLR